MKKILIMIVVVFVMSGCALDSQNQEKHKAKTGGDPYNYMKVEKITVTEYVYIDENGDIIEDPEVIAELDRLREEREEAEDL